MDEQSGRPLRAGLGSAGVVPDAVLRECVVTADDAVGFHGGYRVELRGQEIGRIERHFPTIERKIKGKQYVAWRRKAKRPDYRAGLQFGTKVTCSTLRDAVHHLFAQAMSARALGHSSPGSTTGNIEEAGRG